VRKFNLEQVSRGVRRTVPNIVQCEIWRHWESLTKPDEDSVAEISLTPHLFMKKSQKISYKQAKKVRVMPSSEVVTADLIVTYFDGEATLMLRSEAEEIFGQLLPEYLEDQKKEGKK